jgi:hypothetical protein
MQAPQDTQEEALSQRSTGCAIDLGILDCPPIHTLELLDYVHPDYPDCLFDIEVDWVNCEGSGGFSGVYAGNYRIVSHNCPQYVADLLAAQQQGDAALIDFTTVFSGPVTDQLAFRLSLLNLDNDFNCNGSNFTVTWTRSQCTAVCVTEYDDGITSHRIFNCANTGCCYTTTELCIDDGGGLVVNTTRTPTQSPANCGGGSPLVPAGPFGVIGNPTLPGDGIPSNCTYITKCEFTCID